MKGRWLDEYLMAEFVVLLHESLVMLMGKLLGDVVGLECLSRSGVEIKPLEEGRMHGRLCVCFCCGPRLCLVCGRLVWVGQQRIWSWPSMYVAVVWV